MRGRRGQSSSSVSQGRSRMAPRKQVNKDAADIPCGSQQVEENTQEDERDDNDELSSSLLSRLPSREKRKTERENRSRPKEMTEEEMVDLALRLSEQEASITALRMQKEEETIMKAIQESMLSQTRPCAPSQSQSLLADKGQLRIGSRRKLLYLNRKAGCDDQGASEEPSCAKRSGDESTHWNKKRKREEGSPLLEMPDLSQTQASGCSSDVVELLSDSPQSSDSTQIEECQLGESPVFPSTGCRAEVHIPRLSQDLLQTCRTSGFVLCSQGSLTSSQKSLSAQPKSPTFPKSPRHSTDLTLSKNMGSPKRPAFSETDQGDDGETSLSPECLKSPVFGRNTQQDKCPSACKPQSAVSNSGFMFSSQESLTASDRTASCQPKSPVFPRCPVPPRNLPDPEIPATCRSSVFPETDDTQSKQSHVFDRSGQQQKVHAGVCAQSTASSAAPSHSQTQLRQTDHREVIRLTESSQSDDEDENLKKVSKDQDSAEKELSGEMRLLWSDEDEDVTPLGSPSPVFPDERHLHQADSQDASLNRVTVASSGMTGSNCRPSTVQQHTPNTEQKPWPTSSRQTVSKAEALPVQPADGAKVHYYWGVPFCPRGLDPDDYTQVIVAQMEVYEKSLKQAQRSLLRKAAWGEAILPQPEKSASPESPAESPQQLFPRRRGLRLGGKKQCDAAEAEEEEDKRDRDKVEESENKGEKKNEGDREGQVDTDDCDVCPETQLSDSEDDRTQDLTMDSDAAAELQPKSPEPPKVDKTVRDESPVGDELQEEKIDVDVDTPVDRKVTGNVPVSSSDEGRQNVRAQQEDEEEMKDGGLQGSTSPELEAAVVPHIPEASVDCPICQGSFPVAEIELHAAYCDGEVDDRTADTDCFQVSSKLRRKRTRRAEETDNFSNTAGNQEKCFICQRAVPLRDYSRHTELCIQRQASKSAAKGKLLSALQETESRGSEAGPSGSKLQPGDVIDLRDDDEEEEEEEGCVSAICISNSPIRSFTPISEATDCLVDFKKPQRSKKLSQRRR